MPPACRFTREQIVAAALAITRERGFDAVTARAASMPSLPAPLPIPCIRPLR